jgi:hypothetical protein
MRPFRKLLFILYARRPKGRLLVNREKMGIIEQKILSYSPTVKGKSSLAVTEFINKGIIENT